MKIRNYILIGLSALFALAACDKHEIVTYIDNESTDGKALIQIVDIIPANANLAANKMDSVYVNGKLAANSVAGQLGPKVVLPYRNTFYCVPAGTVKIQFYKGGSIVYDQEVAVSEGQQELYVYNLGKAPVVLDHQGDFSVHSPKGTASTYQMDSVVSYRFVNFLFEGDADTPYSGKLQYQYSNNATNYTDGDWHNLGEPVAWGESTTRNIAIVHKVGAPGSSGNNTAGYQTLRFRCLDEGGNYIVGSGDYWTSYLGRAHTHVATGIKGGSPAWNYMQMLNNI